MAATSSPFPRILLVEDSEDDAFFFRWALKKCAVPCELEHAADGAAAIACLNKCLKSRDGVPRPDLIFLDLKIPNFSGFEVLTWIRERRFNPPLRVAVLSGSQQASDMQRAAQLGAAAYYVKPLTVDQLRAGIAAWQEARRNLPRIITAGQLRARPAGAPAAGLPAEVRWI